jgi:hypothetical protein
MVEGVRWQYRVVSIGAFFAGGRLSQALGHLGEGGWELVTVYDKASNWLQGFEKGFILFKRAVPPGDEPDGPWSQVLSAEQIEVMSDPSYDPKAVPWA